MKIEQITIGSIETQLSKLPAMAGESKESLHAMSKDILAMSTLSGEDTTLPIETDNTWAALLGAVGQACYYRTDKGTPEDPEWVPARITEVRSDTRNGFRVEIKPDRGTDFGDDWHEMPGPYGYTPSMMGGIVVRELDRIRLV